LAIQDTLPRPFGLVDPDWIGWENRSFACPVNNTICYQEFIPYKTSNKLTKSHNNYLVVFEMDTQENANEKANLRVETGP
jgi:hypothetical protein